MRSSSSLAGLILSLAFAAGAHAAAVPATGTLSFQIATLQPITVSGGGTVIVNGSSGVGHLTALGVPSGAFATTGRLVPITDPIAAPISGVQLTVANGAGSFAGSGGSGSFGGVMPLAGIATLCLFGPCPYAIGNLDVPLSVVGQGGAAFATGVVNLTVVGAPWTTGTVSIGALTAMGGVSPASSTDALSLVTPTYIITNIGLDNVIPMFTFLHLSGLSVPEPGTAILLGAGVVALVAIGRRGARHG